MRRALLATASALAVSSCASIISGGSDDIQVKTDPPGADCVLYRGDVTVGHVNPTSGQVLVSRSYTDIKAVCHKEGYAEAEHEHSSGMNPWVLGNLIFGGLTGIIVDLATSNATNYDSECFIQMAALAAPPVQEPAGEKPESTPGEGPIASAAGPEAIANQ